MYDEHTAWELCHPDDLWIFDKLILSKKLGYLCGPSGVDVPKPNYYIIRPITNLLGMGRGAKIVWIDNDTDYLPLSYFWCEVFEGQHLSVDYTDNEQTLCVVGIKDKNSPLYKWRRWKKINKQINFPSILETLVGNYKYINCEFIGGSLVEVHFRHNPDFIQDVDYIEVVWEGEDINPPAGMEFVPDKDFKRIGFFKPKN